MEETNCWNVKSIFCLLFISVFIFSCRPPTESPAPPAQYDPLQLDGKRALEEVRNFIAIGPRHSGSEGAGQAALYLQKRLKELKIELLPDEFNDLTPAGEMTFRNIMGTINGTDPKHRLIILVSHYDTKSGISNDFIGANDSGSSTGLLLELARVLRQGPRIGPDIRLAFLDGEECIEGYGRNDGLHGSRRLARTLVQNRRSDKVMAVIVLDMIGDKNLTVTIPRNSSPELVSLVFTSAREERARLKFSLAEGAITDDHEPFFTAGMPAVNVIDFQFGSAHGENNYWHTTEDTFDKLSSESLETIGRVIIRTINKLLF